MQTDLDYEVGGLSYRRRADGIHEFRLQVVTTISVDAWYETVSAIESHARITNEHVRSLYHVHGLWPTPYAAKRIMEMSHKTSSNLRVSTAVLMEDNAIGVVVVQALLRQIPSTRLNMNQIFFQEEEAVLWLEDRRKLLG
jgi:hypothetical protein